MFPATLAIVSLFVYEHFLSGNPYTFEEAWRVISGSFLIAIGALLVNGSVAYGKGGPTQALIQL